jgi:hypothetical protein
MITINDKFRIDSDKWNWILQEKKIGDPKHQFAKSDAPTERWENVGYYSNIKKLASRLLDEDLKQSDANTLEGIKDTLFHVENSLKI